MMLLSLALLALSVMAPSESCASECAAQAGTDRQTCLLQCDQQETPRSGTGMTHWRRQENLGGAPPGSQHAGEDETVVTTTTTNADGTSTTSTTSTGAKGTVTTNGAAAKPAAVRAATPASSRVREDYPALAKCMNGCDPQTEAHTRAQCKLGCLRLSVHWRANPSRP